MFCWQCRRCRSPPTACLPKTAWRNSHARQPLLADYCTALREEAQARFEEFVGDLRRVFEPHQRLRDTRSHLVQAGLHAPPLFDSLLPETASWQSALRPYLRACAAAGFPSNWVPAIERSEAPVAVFMSSV